MIDGINLTYACKTEIAACIQGFASLLASAGLSAHVFITYRYCDMSGFLYDWLGLFGFSHPLHPVLVHVPIGMSIGAICFSLLAYFDKRTTYQNTAFHANILALVFLFMAVAMGLIDWQRFYGGAWLFEIKAKLVLTVAYLLTLLTAVWLGRRKHHSAVLTGLYALAMLLAMGLGFFGGELVYRGYAPDATPEFQAGRHVFESHCSGCHRRGENIIEPTLPLRLAPQLHNFAEFSQLVREPKDKNGQPSLMPAFSQEKISEQEIKQLYDYLYFSFVASVQSRD